MSKIPKQIDKKQKTTDNYRSDQSFAFRSIIISAVLGCISFIVSLLFNIEVITIFMNVNLLWTFVDLTIKILSVLLFFIFMITSYANYKELIGKRLNWKELLLLVLLSIGQTLLNLTVFILTLIGILIIMIYLFLIQE
ncbi:MAG: hypothetical protein ACFFCY_04615 [Promethearchaeota archaeon]